MKKIITGVIAVLLGLSACSFKREHIEPLSEQEVDQVMSSYYKQPDINKFVRMLAYFDDTDFLKKNKTTAVPLEGFLAGLAVNNAPEWKIVAQEVVWEKNMVPIMKTMPERITMLQHILSSKDAVASDAAALDFLWGAFSSTGDPKFVQVIARTKNRPSVDLLVRSAAAWSLYSQSKQHPIVEQKLKKAPVAPDEFMQKLEAKLQNPE